MDTGASVLMGWGEPIRPRPHPAGGIVVEVAAADHLAKVEAERDRLREFAKWARPVCEYVSIGRGGVGHQDNPYPDASARRALGVLDGWTADEPSAPLVLP